MTRAGSVVFLIPSYQPTEILCGLIEQLRGTSAHRIVIVDDGSGADYTHIYERAAQTAGTTVLRNAINLGKGAALKHGMNHILVHYPDCIGIVTADADGQHSVKDILRVAAELLKTPETTIFGVRKFGGNVPLRSKFGNNISRYAYRL